MEAMSDCRDEARHTGQWALDSKQKQWDAQTRDWLHLGACVALVALVAFIPFIPVVARAAGRGWSRL
jgi:hypothetical protein